MSNVFLLQLPAGYRAKEILAYHARDPESLCERSDGNRIWKALLTNDGPAILELSLEKEGVWVRVHADGKFSRSSLAFLHDAALKMLGLNNETAPFETRHAAFTAPRRGLRLPNIPTGFDGLAWGIIGQQINVKFASSLRSEIIRMAGEKVGGMRAHPTPERVANMNVASLNKRRFSRSKAAYLIGAGETVAKGELDIEGLPRGSAVAAEKKLTALHGVGTWTARYTMLQGRFCRCGAGGRQRAGDRPAASAPVAGTAGSRPGENSDGGLFASSQPCHHASMDQPEGAGMKRYWDTIETPFGMFAAWVDEEGRLLRFAFRSGGAERVDPVAERNTAALEEVRRQVAEYSQGKRQTFEFALHAEGPEFDKRVWKALSRHPVRPDHILWRDRQDYRPARCRPRGRGGQWRQSHCPDRPLPPRHRQRWQPYRVRWRSAAQAQIAGA